MTAAPAELTDDELTDEITTWAGRIAAGEARLLALVGELDAREAWAGPGLLSCAHWLSWRLGMGAGAARERVRVARALRDLPAVAAAFGTGRLSWSQVRAVTRVASPTDEDTYVDLARSCTGAQLERVVRGVRRARRAEEDLADPVTAHERVRTRVRYDEDGTLFVSLRVPAADAPVLLAGLERVTQQLDAERAEQRTRLENEVDAARAPDTAAVAAGAAETAADLAAETAADVPAETRAGPDPAPPDATPADLAAPDRTDPAPPDPADPAPAAPADADRLAWERHLAETAREAAVLAAAHQQGVVLTPATLGDAVVRLAGLALDQPGDVPVAKQRLRLLVDPLSGWARASDGELLPPVSLRQVLRALPGRAKPVRLRPATPDDLTRHDLGRRRRLADDALRAHLGALDGERCRFPGCTRVRRLHAHHVRSWSDGGPTDLANLVLVCARHHTLIHQSGFRLALDDGRRLTVRTAEGAPVHQLPGLPWRAAEELALAADVSAGTLPPAWQGERLDLGHAVWVVLQQAA